MVLEILCVEPINPQYSGVLETCVALRYWFFEVRGSESVKSFFAIIDSRLQPFGCINSLVVWLTSNYDKVVQDSQLVNHEAGYHTFSGLRGRAILCP